MEDGDYFNESRNKIIRTQTKRKEKQKQQVLLLLTLKFLYIYILLNKSHNGYTFREAFTRKTAYFQMHHVWYIYNRIM